MSIFAVFILRLLFKLPMDSLWVILSGITLLSHVVLNKIIKHAYTELSFEVLMCVIRIDFFKFGDAFDKWLFDRYKFTSTSAYTSSYYTMGYTSRNVI